MNPLSKERFCISLAARSYEWLEKSVPKFELFELRMDLSLISFNEFKLIIKENKNCIITFRPNGTNHEIRLRYLLAAVQEDVKFIDIDLDDPILSKFQSQAQHWNGKLIISYHNFEFTPDQKELEKIVKELFDKGAVIGKVACQCQSNSEIQSLLELNQPNQSIIAFGMGSIAKQSRVDCLKVGAPFTYCFFDKETAPGQWSFEELCDLMNQDK